MSRSFFLFLKRLEYEFGEDGGDGLEKPETEKARARDKERARETKRETE